MAAAIPAEDVRMQTPNWSASEEQSLAAGPPHSSHAPPSPDARSPAQEPDSPDYNLASSADDIRLSGSKNATYRDLSHKQVKPNKVYIGGLPEHTREADLQNCFGKIGNIINIELKVGYGFVEFDNRRAAEESVAKYNEGHFMGNKIKVEVSHGGGRTAKFAGDPSACFRCGQMGHWARECPSNNGLPYQRHPPQHDSPLIDRIQRDHSSKGPPPRDDYNAPRYPPPTRDPRYDYPPPPRKPLSPRDYRDYAPPRREFDEYRRVPPSQERERYPPADYRGRYGPPPDPVYRGYGGPPPPPPPVPYDRYDRRGGDRYGNYSAPPPPPRARTPPRVRDDYERLPPREYTDFRGRPPSPHRYSDFNRPSEPPGRFRHRSQSPSRPPNRPLNDYPSNGYGSGPSPGTNLGPPPLPRGNPRDYTPLRNGRDLLEPGGNFRRP